MLAKRERSLEVKVDCFVEVTEAAFEYLAHVIGLVPGDKREWKPSEDAWSLKDVLAHIAWHDDQMIEVCEKRDLAGSSWWTLPLEERNQNIYEQYRDTPLDEILEFFKTSHAYMMKALKTLSDEDLNDPKRFHDMPEDWTPWRMLANNTYEHYIRHIGQIHAIARRTRDEGGVSSVEGEAGSA